MGLRSELAVRVETFRQGGGSVKRTGTIKVLSRVCFLAVKRMSSRGIHRKYSRSSDIMGKGYFRATAYPQPPTHRNLPQT